MSVRGEAEAMAGKRDEAVRSLSALATRGRSWRYSAGQPLMHEGMTGHSVTLLCRGRVGVTMRGEDKRSVFLAIRDAGALLGEMSVLSGEARTATVTALTDCAAVVIAHDVFREAVREQPDTARVVFEQTAQRLREAERRLWEASCLDTMGRVASRLVELADRYGDPDDEQPTIELPMDRVELATWVGASREGVSRALHALMRLGWVAGQTPRRLLLRDMDALRIRGGWASV